jgi:hypothetical protein
MTESIEYVGKVKEVSEYRTVALEYFRPGEEVIKVTGYHGGVRTVAVVEKIWKNGVVVIEGGSKYEAPEVNRNYSKERETGKAAWELRFWSDGPSCHVYGRRSSGSYSVSSNYIRKMQEGESRESIVADEEARQAEQKKKANEEQAKRDAHKEKSLAAILPYWEDRQTVKTSMGKMHIIEHPHYWGADAVWTLTVRELENPHKHWGEDEPETVIKIDAAYRYADSPGKEYLSTGTLDVTGHLHQDALAGYAVSVDILQGLKRKAERLELEARVEEEE